MGKGSSPKTGSVNVWDKSQKAIAQRLAGQTIPELLAMKPLTGEELDLALMGESWTKGVAGPMMREFQTYAIPTIKSQFRRGGLFSAGRGNAVQRALEGLQSSLTANLAERNWAATLAKTSMLEKPYYNPSAGVQAALGLLGTKSKEAYGVQGQAGPDYLGAGAQLGSAGIIALALSDKRLKTDIKPFDESVLNAIESIDVYCYKLNGIEEIGLMAQDLEKYFPEVVTEVDGVKEVKLYPLMAILFKAIKDLSKGVR